MSKITEDFFNELAERSFMRRKGHILKQADNLFKSPEFEGFNK